MSNISLKRIHKEYQNMIKDPSEDFFASPIKDDMFCWHFTIRGPPDTEFEGGLYHGVIKLPMSYPNRPPNIMFLTPNGRFDINMDVCLSMTKYHKEEWQAAWTIRSMLEAIIAFFPIREDHDAIGALESSVESRKYYAKQSIKYKCDICGPIAKILKPIEKITSNNENKNNTTENKNSEENIDNENKNISNNTNNNNTNIDKNVNNKNIKSVQNNIKKDIDSSSNSSLSSNQTGKFRFKRDINNASDNKKIYITKAHDNKNANKEILLNPKEEKEEKEENVNNNINNNEQEELFNYINPEPEPNNLLKSIIDDIEYVDIKKSIKFHGNKKNEDIEASLLNKNKTYMNNFLKIKNLFNLKIDKDEDNKSADEDYSDIWNKKAFDKDKNELYEKKMEENIKENIKYIKYFSRKNYEDIRDKKKRNLAIIMSCIVAFVFLMYFFCSKYQSSINSFLISMLLPNK